MTNRMYGVGDYGNKDRYLINKYNQFFPHIKVIGYAFLRIECGWSHQYQTCIQASVITSVSV